MTTRTHFVFRIDLWDEAGDNILEHVAGVEDYTVARAAYEAAIVCMIDGLCPR